MLSKMEDNHIIEIEEFVNDKFVLVNNIYKTKKETNNVVGLAF